MSNKLSSVASLAQRGTNATNPPNWVIYKRNPTTADSKNFSLGDLWLNKITKESWCLVSLAGNLSSHGNLIADWIKISNVASELTITGNDHVPVEPSVGGNINLLGDGTSVLIFGIPSTNSLVMSLIGSSGSKLTLTGDTGGVIHSGPSNNVNLLGAAGLEVTGSPLTNTLTVGPSGIASTFHTDAGNAVPSSGILNVVGGSNINTSGTGNTVTVNLDSTLTGITNLTVNNLTVTTSADFSYLTEGVLQSDGSGNITSSKGTDGQVLIGSTAGAPVWANITAGANISITNASNSITISKSSSGGNGWVFIQTINGAGGTFSGLTNTYKTYVLVIHKFMFNQAATANVLVQLSSDNGVTFYTSNYTSGLTARLDRGVVSPYPITSTATNGYAIAYLDGSFGLYQNTACTAYLYNLADSSTPKLMASMFSSGVYGGTYCSFGYASGAYTGSLTGPVNAIRVSLSAAPITTGSWAQSMTLYGLTS
jgi:hypothetical protein